MHQRIEKIRSSEEVNTKYMQDWEEKRHAEEKARAEGKAELILGILEDLGKVSSDLHDKIMSETNADVLKSWNLLAARSNSVEEFEKAIG